LPNLQIGVGSLLSTDPRSIDEPPRSGDLHLSALYNFNQETVSLPAFGLKLRLNTPTGVGAREFGIELKGIVTKSMDRLAVHLNAGYEFLTAPRDGERDRRYNVTVGASPRVVWDVGLGTEIAGPATRSQFFMTTGFSFGF
jgi:hypothetical protein